MGTKITSVLHLNIFNSSLLQLILVIELLLSVTFDGSRDNQYISFNYFLTASHVKVKFVKELLLSITFDGNRYNQFFFHLTILIRYGSVRKFHVLSSFFFNGKRKYLCIYLRQTSSSFTPPLSIHHCSALPFLHSFVF